VAGINRLELENIPEESAIRFGVGTVQEKVGSGDHGLVRAR
jgi:hypothetical protein